MKKLGKVLYGVLIALLIFTSVSSVYLYHQVARQASIDNKRAEQGQVYIRRVVGNTCGFFTILGQIPVPKPPSATNVYKSPPISRLGTEIIINSRNAVYGLGCPMLGQPSTNLVYWATQFGLTVKH